MRQFGIVGLKSPFGDTIKILKIGKRVRLG